ncbi:MAG: NAD(P)-dependent dehydrogenase (short-subunit alcohol dehydrogenase family) [Myxococcota bacterium]|jgi:NAD(P)-dependent dehydrogenase (short-subunit alcohol dehydrogenase family)/NAD(P)H-dependent FMN reductase
MKRILAFAASTSSTSINRKLVGYAASLVADAEVELLDLNDFEMPIYSGDVERDQGIPALAQAFLDKIAASDALIVSFAEHNGSYTAAFKNIFDWASRIETKVFQDKQMVMLSTSPGRRGGQTVLAQAVSAAPRFGGRVTASLAVPRAHTSMDLTTGKVVSEPLHEALAAAIRTLDHPPVPAEKAAPAPVAVVMGVGPGIGGAMAQRYAKQGYRVVCVARRAESVAQHAEAVGGVGMTCDVTDGAQVTALFARIQAEVGPVDVLLWNVGAGGWGDIDSVPVDGLDLAYQTNARGLFLAAQAVAPQMRDTGGATIVVTGATASLRGKPGTTAFAAGKAAQRSLTESLARTLWPQGIHVALLIIDGMVDAPAARAKTPNRGEHTWVSPDGVADAAWFLTKQDRRAWTFQMEIRPAVEPW